MTRMEAAKILEQMLNGIHPVTGEILPENHVCAETIVMRALHAGYAALLETQETDAPAERTDCIPASRANTHKRWSDEEDQYLHQAWSAGVTIDDMRRVLSRTLRSVKCRLIYLGIAEYAILERKYQPPKGCEHSGLPWYPEEEEALQALFAAGISPLDIARQLKRSLRAVVLRMVNTGMITEEDKDALLARPQEGGTPS